MTDKRSKIFISGGSRLKAIKAKLKSAIKAGTTPLQIDALAEELITKAGDSPSFKTVSGYHYTTCINRNHEMLHGLPNGTPFKKSDVVTVDVGLVHQGYHLDTSFTVQIPPFDTKTQDFLKVGQNALSQAIAAARPGNTVYDISLAMQQAVEKAGCSVSTQMVGHGIGHHLHEEPQIPCFASSSSKKHILRPGQTIAIEVMYAAGAADLVLAADGWTLQTRDGSLSAMFEESVLITDKASQILT